MGLKYDFFMLKMSDEEFLKQLEKFGMEDCTELMKRRGEWNKFKDKLYSDFKEGFDNNLFTEDEVEEISQALINCVYATNYPEGDEELKQYILECNSIENIKEFHIFWRSIPNSDWIFGAYTNFKGWGYINYNKLDTVFLELLYRAGIEKVWLSQYHHGADEGRLNIIDLINDEVETLKNDPFSEDNYESYETFSERITRERGIPIEQLHNHLSNLPPYSYINYSKTTRITFDKISQIFKKDDKRKNHVQK